MHEIEQVIIKRRPTPKRLAKDAVLKFNPLRLIRYVPSGTYFARLRVRGKLIRQSLKTDVLSVAKLRLDGHKLSARSYMHNRSAVNLLFNYAADRKRRYVRENIVAHVDKIDIEETEPEVFTPEEARKLIANVTEDFLPCLAIGLFVGLRSAEIQR